MLAIDVQDVSFRYGGDHDLLSGTTFATRPGEVVGLLGTNGAGKTTLFRLLVGLLQPRTGEIRVLGLSVAREPRRANQRIGFLPDEPWLYPKLSARENMNRFALLWGVPARDAKSRSEAWLQTTELWAERDRLVGEYSRGMRQRLAIGCALLHSPDVILLDEPFNGLDMKSQLWLREFLRTQAEAGRSVLVSSHQPEALDALSDRLAILQHGRIDVELSRSELAAQGGTAEVFSRYDARALHSGGGR